MVRIEGVVFGMCPILHLKDGAFVIGLINILDLKKCIYLVPMHAMIMFGDIFHCIVFVIIRLPYLSCQ